CDPPPQHPPRIRARLRAGRHGPRRVHRLRCDAAHPRAILRERVEGHGEPSLMPTLVEVPKLGNTVEECIIARWEKRKGDTVAAGDLVAEIETDKATFEVTAPVGGTILETCFETGALAPVFATLFIVGDPGEAPAAPVPAETSAPALS